MTPSPTVLISWSHADPGPDQADRRLQHVRALADELRHRGIDATVDLYRLDDGVDWNRWGPNEVVERDHVLVILGPRWRDAWEGKGPPDVGAGAAAEANALQSEFARNRDQFLAKIRLVSLPGATPDDIPNGLHGPPRLTVDPSTGEGINELVRSLTGQPRFSAPPLGPVPRLDPIPPAGARVVGSPVRYAQLSDVPVVSWRGDWDRLAGQGQPTVTLHCLPVPLRRIPNRERGDLADTIVGALRDSDLVDSRVGIAVDDRDSSVAATVEQGRRAYHEVVRHGTLLGLRVEADTTQVSISFSVPRDQMGGILDPTVLATDLASGIRVAAVLVGNGDPVAFAFEVAPLQMLSAGTVAELGRNSAQFPLHGRRDLRMDPDESVTTSDLAGAADTLGRSLAGSAVRLLERR